MEVHIARLFVFGYYLCSRRIQMSKCPAVTQLENDSYNPPAGYELMKYLNAGNHLAMQGDIAFCENHKAVSLILQPSS